MAELSTSASDGANLLYDICTEVCPVAGNPDYHRVCADRGHPYHSTRRMFAEAASKRATLQWGVFGVSMFTSAGALFRTFFPSFPYTVGVLLIGFSTSILAQSLASSPDCPFHAFAHSGADGLVSRAEWDNFVCTGTRARRAGGRKGGPAAAAPLPAGPATLAHAHACDGTAAR
jgi:hypothetical protein